MRGAGSNRLARWLDDYVEEVAVGTSWWVLPLIFGAGFPVSIGLVFWLFRIRFPSQEYGLLVILGLVTGIGLHLVARERERYRAGAVGRSSDLRALRAISWQDFEVVVGELIRRQGYTVKERGGFRADKGIDLIAEGRRGKLVVQCKQWVSKPVGLDQVKQLFATVKAEGFAEGWLVASGRFTDQARSWARGKELRLVDGAELSALLAPADQAEPSGRECPECGMPMRRQNNGSDGTKFWGCTGFPACRFTAEDAPTTADLVVCERGHPMVRRVTRRSVAYWGCSTYPSCRRKKLLVEDLVPAR